MKKISSENLCNICPRKCNVDRRVYCGSCRMTDTLRIAYVGLHHGEEPIISGTRGSGTIFFSGCNLRCDYCQNHEVSHHGMGNNYSQNDFIEAMRRLKDEGANNINLVTGNHFAPQIMRALDKYHPNIPICYNTSSYDSIPTLQALDPYIDIYLADLKFLECFFSYELSRVDDYPAVAVEAIKFMRKKPDIFATEGSLSNAISSPDTAGTLSPKIMTSGLVIRHLALPSYSEVTHGVTRWLRENMPSSTYVSIMSQYTPIGRQSMKLCTPLSKLEHKLHQTRASKMGFPNLYVQELSSSDKCYIPPFVGKPLWPHDPILDRDIPMIIPPRPKRY